MILDMPPAKGKAGKYGKIVSTRVDDETLEKLKAIAKAEEEKNPHRGEMKMAQVLDWAIAEFVANHKPKR